MSVMSDVAGIPMESWFESSYEKWPSYQLYSCLQRLTQVRSKR